MRGFLERLALVFVLAYAAFTLMWVNAHVFGYEATLYIDRWGEAAVEGLVLSGVFWAVMPAGLYFLAVDGGLLGKERAGVDRGE